MEKVAERIYNLRRDFIINYGERYNLRPNTVIVGQEEWIELLRDSDNVTYMSPLNLAADDKDFPLTVFGMQSCRSVRDNELKVGYMVGE